MCEMRRDCDEHEISKLRESVGALQEQQGMCIFLQHCEVAQDSGKPYSLKRLWRTTYVV